MEYISIKNLKMDLHLVFPSLNLAVQSSDNIKKKPPIFSI